MLNDRVRNTEIEAGEWCLGTPVVPVTMLEYGDFECSRTAVAQPVLASLVALHPDTVRLVYRHFPVSTLHPHAVIAAEAAEAAGAQGAFWAMHDMLFRHQENLEYPALLSYALGIGLDLARFEQDMNTRRYRREVRIDVRRGVMDGANRTPAIFLNRVRHTGRLDYESLLGAVGAQRQRTRAHGGV